MSTKFLSPGWRMPRNANQSKQSNYSMDFDGSQYIRTSSGTSFDFGSNAFSFSGWVKRTSIGDSTNVILFIQKGATGTTPTVQIRQNARNIKVDFNVGSTWSFVETTTNPIGNDTNWHHLAVTKSGTSMSIYFDGVLQDTGTAPATLDASNGTSSIGARGGNTQNWNGNIDAVSIFNYALSSSQITTLYGSSSTGIGNPMSLSPKPVAYYPLGGSAGAFRTPVNVNDQWLIENNAIGDYVFDFDGSNDITVSHSSSLDQSVYSFSFWVNNDLNSGVSNDGIITADSTTRGWSILQDNQTFKFNPNISGGSGQIDVTNFFNTTSTWIHCAITFDGTDLIVYKNGTSVGSSSSGTRNLNSNNNPLTIGNNTFASGRFFNGKLSNAQIFNTALSGPEVETLYNYGSPIRTLANIPQNSNLKAWYKLDASEVYNSSTTEWEVNNALSPWTSSLSFGSNGTSHVALGLNSTLPTTAITLSLWVRSVDNSQNYKPIFLTKSSISGQDASIYILTMNTGSVAIKIMTDAGFKQNFSVPAGLNDNKWHHISVTYDGTNIAYYTDGALYTTELLSGTISYDTTTYPRPFIGTNPSATSSYFKGEVSNFQIFNTALPATGSNSVETLYNNGFPLPDMSGFTSLLNWYKLDNLTTGIEDSKGTQNGTNSGAVEAVGSVSTLNGTSSGMSQANLVQSDLQTVAPYSKYAMNFDSSSGDYIDYGDSNDFSFGDTYNDSPFSVSFFVNLNSHTLNNVVFVSKDDGSPNREYGVGMFLGNRYIRFFIKNAGGDNQQSVDSTTILAIGSWYHVVATYDGRGGSNAADGMNLYINSIKETTNLVKQSYTAMSNTTAPFRIGQYVNQAYVDGKISNASIWNTALTSTQVTEIYNEGLPSNLNSHSAYSNLVSWWQLGENSSFNGNDWIVADEKGTNNGESDGMGVDALTNGVGTTANGVSSGMSEGNLVGDAPYSTANAISSGMSVVSRVTGVSDATITTGGTGYFTGTNIATTGGSGTNCTINITTVSGGAITAITINSGGNNYLIGDVLTVSGGNGNATITVSGLNTP